MLIDGEWKYISKSTENGCWGGPTYPNASTLTPPCNTTDCDADGGCLFNIYADPGEHLNLITAEPTKVMEMVSSGNNTVCYDVIEYGAVIDSNQQK